MRPLFIISFITITCTIALHAQPKNTFTIWATADAHIGADAKKGRKSLERAILQSEGKISGYSCFKWDLMLHMGDISGNLGAPNDDEGALVKEQLHAASLSKREDIYNLMGNHDASSMNQPNHWWFRKWVDPFGTRSTYSGVDSTLRKYKLHGNIDRYYIEIGNILIIMLSDENQGPTPWGRGNERGGYPAGRIELETFNWWKDLVEANQDKIIITCAHHMLRNTTTASGFGEGILYNMHGYKADGASEGASYLYFIGNEPNSNKFHDYFATHPGAIDMWLGGHTHLNIGKTYGNKKMIEERFGVTFVNVSALTRHHNNTGHQSTPMSRLIQFVEHSDTALIRLYLHESTGGHRGFAPLFNYRVPLSKKAKPPIDTTNASQPCCEQTPRSILVYPNPLQFGRTLHVFFDSLDQAAEIQLVDLLGHTLLQQTVTPNGAEQIVYLDTQFYPKGIYFLRINSNGSQKIEKLLII